MDCSVIIPVYFNSGSLHITFDKVNKVLSKDPYIKNYELVFIDDGSGDNSYNELIDIKSNNPGLVTVIKLTRNFGQLAAVMAGYHHTHGKCVINISADLQDPPELITQMIQAHFVNNAEIVVCYRDDRDEGMYRKLTSKLFYNVMRKLSFANMPTGGFDYALVSRKVIKAFSGTYEANSFWQGQILWTGYNIRFIPYTRLKREIGKSRWTFTKKIKYLLDGVMAYSYFPLRFMAILGLILFLAGLIYAVIIFISYFSGNIPFKGWAPIMILLLVLSGIQMLMLGIIGEYLWRTLDQVRGRPQYVVEEVL